MTHEELCEGAHDAYTGALSKHPKIPNCYRPREWQKLTQAEQEALRTAVAAVQRSKSGSPKREAYDAYERVMRPVYGAASVVPEWETVHEATRAAWAAFANFVIKEGRLN